MDHYRMILNVTNPQLARVGSAVNATRHRTRLIKSAKPMLESGPDRPQSAAAMDFLPRPKLPMRAPSAPAVGRLHVSRPYSTMSMPSEQPKKDESQGRQSRVRIEVDGVDQGYYSRYSRGGSTISRFVFMLLYKFLSNFVERFFPVKDTSALFLRNNTWIENFNNSYHSFRSLVITISWDKDSCDPSVWITPPETLQEFLVNYPHPLFKIVQGDASDYFFLHILQLISIAWVVRPRSTFD